MWIPVAPADMRRPLKSFCNQVRKDPENNSTEFLFLKSLYMRQYGKQKEEKSKEAEDNKVEDKSA